MFIGCGLCNGIAEPGRCPVCGGPMKDLGMREDYFGPYSPYQDGELIERLHRAEGKDSFICIHLVYCPSCQYHGQVKIPI